MKQRIILVDDDSSLNQILSAHLEEGGYEVSAFLDPEEGVNQMGKEDFHLVITDMKMKPLDGLAVLKKARFINPEVPVIMITGHATVKNAVESMKLGAYDYITKPFSREEFLHIVGNALDHYRLKKENLQLKRDLSGRFNFNSIIGTSTAMAGVFDLMEKALEYNVTVLITGESGTGKELVARAIHYNGPRRDKPFVVVNCASIPDALVESELFGHVRGAFTGALRDRRGKFQDADGGSIFLDEIGDLKLDLQAKLLRVLQGGEFERIGEGKPVEVDVRVIAATNRDLDEMEKQGAFREDLYYRVSVFPIHIPPLRERREDIPLLAEHFVQKYAVTKTRTTAGTETRTKMGTGTGAGYDSRVRIGREAEDALFGYHWPGNVRELENVIERALVLSGGKEIKSEHLPRKLIESGDTSYITVPDEGINLEEIEKNLIIQALDKANGNRARAARFLGLTRPTLIYRLEKYGLEAGARRREGNEG